jgi:dTDP-4-amino-4,6-dideoxygalactose transaminase
MGSSANPVPPADWIPFARPSVGREEEDAVLAVLRSGWLTTGGVTHQFETEFARYTGARHALAVNSATAGLHLAVEALGVGRDDEVITTPYTFAATAEVVRYVGAHPRFVDIEEHTLNIDPRLVERACAGDNARLRALLPVHLGGLPCDMAALSSMASAAGLPVIEDCAHAFPVKTGGRFLGLHGRIGVFSFYANKTITTGEGGMIVTDDEKLAARMRVMRLHGIDRESWDRYTSASNGWYYEIVEAGYKYNLTDIASAIGREQLKKAASLKARRARRAAFYLEELRGLDWLTPPVSHPDHAWHLFPIRLTPGALSLNRDDFIHALAERGIGASVHYTPLHVMPYYRKKYGFKPEDFPVSLAASRSCLSLPLYPDLTEEQAARVVSALKTIADEHLPAHRKR